MLRAAARPSPSDATGSARSRRRGGGSNDAGVHVNRRRPVRRAGDVAGANADVTNSAGPDLANVARARWRGAVSATRRERVHLAAARLAVRWSGPATAHAQHGRVKSSDTRLFRVADHNALAAIADPVSSSSAGGQPIAVLPFSHRDPPNLTPRTGIFPRRCRRRGAARRRHSTHRRGRLDPPVDRARGMRTPYASAASRLDGA